MKNENIQKSSDFFNVEVSYPALSATWEQPSKFAYDTDPFLEDDSEVFAAAFIKKHMGIPLPMWVKHFRKDGTVKLDRGVLCSNLFTKLGPKRHIVDVHSFRDLVGKKS